MSGDSAMPTFGRVISSLVFLAQVAGAESTAAGDGLTVEVFTTLDRPLAESTSEADGLGRPQLQVYQLDGLSQLEAALSRDLPPEPEAARAEVLRRIAQLDRDEMAAGRQAASGLIAALAYGIDRYSAVVINGEAVVYGLTDVNEALRHYADWRESKAK
jgi:integrating conjugative element protein (TIGR03757 family)